MNEIICLPLLQKKTQKIQNKTIKKTNIKAPIKSHVELNFPAVIFCGVRCYESSSS